MFTAQSYDALFFTRLRHDHPQLHPNHIGLIRLAHAAAFDDLDDLDRELEMLTMRRREILDRLRAYRRRMWPGMEPRHQRRPCRDAENPLPPAAVDADPAGGDMLRRVAVAIIGRHGPVSLRELHGLIHRYGYVIDSARPVQRLADAMAYEVRHGRLERVRRGVYGPVPHSALPAGESLRGDPLPWRAPVGAEADRAMEAAELVDRAVDPAVRDDPERWSGRAWPESAQAGGAWSDGAPDPFVAELADDLAATVWAARQRVAALYAERLGPPPPRHDPSRPQSSYGWARTYPPRTPKPFPADAVTPPTARPAEPSAAATPEPSTLEPSTLEPSTLEPSTLEPSTLEPSTLEPSTLQAPRDSIGNDSSTNRSRWSEGGVAAGGEGEVSGASRPERRPEPGSPSTTE